MKPALWTVAGINLLLVPFWVLAWFGIASGIGSGSRHAAMGYALIYAIPAHLVLSLYSLVHYLLVRREAIRNAVAVVLLVEQALPAAFVLYVLLRGM